MYLEDKMNRMVIDPSKMDELRCCLEILNAIETIEYHNMNWLPTWATRNPGGLNREKRDLLERALSIVGTSASQEHT